MWGCDQKRALVRKGRGGEMRTSALPTFSCGVCSLKGKRESLCREMLRDLMGACTLSGAAGPQSSLFGHPPVSACGLSA